ncbi:unnamed protein product [Euphydryas editha]|uniref:Uncharacterized protein n=1 Tax=Euphydryas editha TaxID=104508 RepID=A0AAU9UB76_EUPED|nr:unnamed protein product [Euphydryas editha]
MRLAAPSSGAASSPGVPCPHHGFHPPSASVRRHAPPRLHVTTAATSRPHARVSNVVHDTPRPVPEADERDQ